MNKFIPVIVVGVIALGGGFFGGTKYQKSHGTATISFGDGSQRGQFTVGANGQGGARRIGGANGGGFVAGEVLSKDDKSITLKLPAGGSSIVFYSNSTSIEKTASGSWDDITVGKSIVVTGTTNSDGSTTATSIQLSRPVMFRAQGSTPPAAQ